MDATEIVVVVCVCGVLLLSIIALLIQRSFSAKRDSLFGSVVKNAPKHIQQDAAPFTPLKLLHIQPSISDSRTDDMSFSSNNYGDQSGDKGLSSVQSRWSSQDKGSEHSDDESQSNLNWKLWFKIEYTAETDVLEVTIFRAKCTPDRYLEKHKTSVTVCIFLLPDDVSAQTSHYANTGTPSFDETFTFLVQPSDLSSKLLRLSMYELDAHRTRICLGHTVVRICDHMSPSGGIVYLYKDLEQLATAFEEPSPEIHVSLMYNIPKEKLKIQIFAAKNFPETPAGHKYYLRTNVILGSKTAKSKQTELCDCIADIFQCTYNFGIPVRAMDTCCLQFSVIEKASTGVERLYGRLSVGSCMYAHGTGLDHWKSMMANTKKVIEMWHKLTISKPDQKSPKE